MAQRPTTPESFWARTELQDGCLVYTGTRTRKGYGRVGYQGRLVFAHRLAFYFRNGRWPQGILRHLCNNPPCVLHVVEGTHSENRLDAVEAGTHNNARKTHCPQGHPYDDANTRWYGTTRLCKECGRVAALALYHRRMAEGTYRQPSRGR